MGDLNGDALAALSPILAVLRRQAVRLRIGGSLAGSAMAMARSTLAAHLVADLQPERAAPLVHALERELHVDPHAVEEAIRRRTGFDVIHLSRMCKVDVLVLKPDGFDQEAMCRARPVRLSAQDPASEVPVSAPEDTILQTLRWYRRPQRARSDRTPLSRARPTLQVSWPPGSSVGQASGHAAGRTRGGGGGVPARADPAPVRPAADGPVCRWPRRRGDLRAPDRRGIEVVGIMKHGTVRRGTIVTPAG